MKTIFRLTLLCSLLPLLSCQDSGPLQEASSDGAQGSENRREMVLVRQPFFDLREAPGEEGRALLQLQVGDSLYYLGERSTFTTSLTRRGRKLNEPWLLVETPGGQQGWAYAAAFESMKEYSILTRLQYLLGPELAQQVLNYQQALAAVDSAAALATILTRTEQLRDTLVEALEGQELAGESLSWLKKTIPTLLPQPPEEEGKFHLFIDYRPFVQMASNTPGPADDQFVQIYLMVYPIDSIEYFYPVWAIQPEKGTRHSLLGRGMHYRLLEELDKVLVYKDLFGEKIDRLRQQIVNDITGASVTYWEPQQKVLAELNRILEADFSVLTKANRIALQARRQQFEDPDRYQIKLNYRSGIYGLEGPL